MNNNHINIEFNTCQKLGFNQLESFLHSNGDIFILQGYAGTGKTTLIDGLVKYLTSIDKQFAVLAPTGRAAKILREKTGFGRTIHSQIYSLSAILTGSDPKQEDDMSIWYTFPISNEMFDDCVFIVDEASMISSRESKSELFKFGTDILLDDLLTYTGVPHTRNKIIFVGDPAQLPPVGDSESKALMPSYFQSIGFQVETATLTEVMRQQDNTILSNATKIRSLIGVSTKSTLELDYDLEAYIEIGSDQIALDYVNKYPIPDFGNAVVIAYSNQQCLSYNKSIREMLFKDHSTVKPGDLLMINHNNYNNHGVELLNGEIIKVIRVDDQVLSRNNIPVYESVNGERVKKYISFDFRRVVIKKEFTGQEVECLINVNLLNTPERDLSVTEVHALYIDFVIRFNEEQKIRKEQGLEVFRVGSKQFIDMLKSDSYFNAVRVKYGYAVTCHKAQGGEWDTVYVDYFGRADLKDDPLRWCYTATTRAKRRLYAANAPNIGFFKKFDITGIVGLSSVPINALSLLHVPISPYHSVHHHRAKSLKYWEISSKLADSPFRIKSVESFGEYRERYTIAYEDGSVQIQSDHDGAGLFNPFSTLQKNDNEWVSNLLTIVNADYQHEFNISYEPSSSLFNKLFSVMQSACKEASVLITNVEEKTDKYFVNYYLKSAAKFSMIQFYFNGNQQLTKALPKSTNGLQDQSLQLLITNLKNYVIQ